MNTPLMRHTKSIALAILLLALAGIALAGLHPHDLKYRIEYFVGFFPLSGKIDQALTRNEDGTWLLERSGLIYGFKATEMSRFMLNGDDIEPLWYLRNQTGLLKDNFAEINFDKNAHPRIYDPITLSLRIALDLQKNPKRKEFSYIFADKPGKAEPQTYVITDRETIETPIGDIPTVVIQRKPEGDTDREYIYWLAPEIDYSIVRMRTIENDKTKIEINIKGGSIGNRKL